MSTPRKPTIAIAGLAIETSTFHPGRTRAADFHPRHGTAEIIAYHAAVIGPGTPLGDAANWKGALIGHALPGGQVRFTDWHRLKTELLTRLRSIVAEHAAENADRPQLDGLWLDIHGAMCVSGPVRDAEAALLREIREVVGPDCVVSASMDLHGNVSRDLAHLCDLLTCYRTAPHVDVTETRARACGNLIEVLRRKEEAGEKKEFRPVKAWVPIPILLPGEQTSTRDEPARSIYAAVPGVEAADGVLDAAVWVGYAWADEPRNRAAVVVTGWDEGAVASGAEKLARLFWDSRGEFHFVAPTGSLAECLDTGLARIKDETKRPFFISDSGDNPTAGASGYVTWGLARVLEREEFKQPDGPQVIYASVPTAGWVQWCAEQGVGATVTVTVGSGYEGKLDAELTMTGRVHSFKLGDKDAKTEVVLQVGSVFAILTEQRKPYHKEKDFTDLNLEPRKADIVIVKIGYLEPELYDMAKDWMLGLTPGGVDQDLARLGHKEIRRPMWPLDKDFDKEPDLSARIIAMSNEKLEGPDELSAGSLADERDNSRSSESGPDQREEI